MGISQIVTYSLASTIQTIHTVKCINKPKIYVRVTQTVFPADRLWFRKITTHPQILAHVNVACTNSDSEKFKN